MSFKPIRIAAALLALAPGLQACAPVDPGMGEALAYDKAIQTVDPDPQYAATDAQPGSDGDHGAKASERYRKGQTKPVQIQSTASGGSGSGSGGSGPK